VTGKQGIPTRLSQDLWIRAREETSLFSPPIVSFKCSVKVSTVQTNCRLNAVNAPKTKDLCDWKARLVHRKYTEWTDPSTAGQFSARIEHNGTGCYFPLGSADESRAAVRALEIHHCVQTSGWNLACKRYRREFTLAGFWSNNPLLCTYTTLFTSPGKTSAPASSNSDGPDSVSLIVVEAHNLFRQALLNWASHIPGCQCVNAVPSPNAARSQLNCKRADLVLFDRNLSEIQLGVTGSLPSVASVAFAFGIYETSDDIFISHTGVSRGYFLQRTPPSQVLAPVTGSWSAGDPGTEDVLLRTKPRYWHNLIIVFVRRCRPLRVG
jgi:hypothetical protein